MILDGNLSTPAIVPILPALHSLLVVGGVGLVSLLTLVGLAGTRERRRRILRFLWRQKYSLVVLAAAVVSAYGAARRLSAIDRAPATATTRSTEDWRMHRGNATRTARQGETLSPSGGGIEWSSARSYDFHASPAVVGDRVYCIGVRGNSGRIFCWRTDSGELLWNAAPTGFRPTYSSPVISGDFLYCGEGLHDTTDARVLCIDLRPGHEGETVWSFRTRGHVECTPWLADDRLFVAAGDDGVYALSLDPHVPEHQRVLWHAPGSRCPDAETGLAADGERVFVGLGEGESALCVLDWQTGRERARIPMPYPVHAPPAIADGRLYLAMGRGSFLTHADDPAGRIACVDIETLQVLWSHETPATILGAVVVDEEQVIVGCADGVLSVLDGEGHTQRTFDTRAPLLAAPAVTDSTIYVVNADGWLLALGRRRLQRLWELKLGPPHRYLSSPVVAHGHVYLGTEGSGFVCAGRASEEDDRDEWAGRFGGPGRAASDGRSLLSPVGRVLWQYKDHSPRRGAPHPPTNILTVSQPVAITRDEIVLTASTPAGRHLVCLKNLGDAPPLERWRFDGARQECSPLAIGGDSVLATVIDDATQGEQLICLDRATGRRQWERSAVSSTADSLLLHNSLVYVQDSPRRLSCLSLENDTLWSVETGVISFAPHVREGILVAALTNPPALAAFDRQSGRTLWHRPLAAPPDHAPVVIEDRILLPTHSGIEIRSLLDGAKTGRHKAGHAVSGLYCDLDFACFVSSDGKLHVATPASLAETRRVIDVPGGSRALVGRDGILVSNNTQIERYTRAGMERSPWCDLASLGGATSPPILHDGRVYVGIEGRGLVCLGEGAAP